MCQWWGEGGGGGLAAVSQKQDEIKCDWRGHAADSGVATKWVSEYNEGSVIKMM